MVYKLLIHINRDLTRWIRRWTRKHVLPSVVWNSTVDKNFSFCNFRLFLAPGSSSGPIQMKSSIKCIRGNGCIKRKIFNGGIVQR